MGGDLVDVTKKQLRSGGFIEDKHETLEGKYDNDLQNRAINREQDPELYQKQHE